MRVISVYLGIYFALVAGAFIALWVGGVLQHVPLAGLVAAFAVAVGVGVITFVVWRWNPGRTRE